REPGSLRAQEEGRKCPLGKKNSQPGRASEISTLNFCVKLPARKKLDMPAFSNPTVANEAQLRRTIVQLELKQKSETLKDLLHKKWVIENLSSNSIESLYIQNIDNPQLNVALGILASQGLIFSLTLRKGQTLAQAVSAFKLAAKEAPGAYTTISIVFGAVATVLFYINTNYSDTAQARDSYLQDNKMGRLESAYNSLIKSINIVSSEIIELEKQLK
ncbi:MAG: hypothetical protein ACK5W9_05140, partial [Bdellovibrionales bacterium]